MRSHPTSSTHQQDVQKRSRHPRSTFEFSSHKIFRPVSSFILKAIKRWHHVQGFLRSKPQHPAASTIQHKRSKYAHIRPPPPLATDLALMQFTGGGNMETHIRRVMEEQAKAVGGSRGIIVGIADVYRDSNGGIWWDEDEEIEYARLLDDTDWVKTEDDAGEPLWEDFGATTKNCRQSTSSTSSELDLRYLLPPPEVDSYPTFTSGDLNDRVLASTSVGGQGMDALSLPSRPSRQARHLLQPVSLVDFQAFGKLNQTCSPSPPSERNQVGDARADHKPIGAVRRRRIPLNHNSTTSDLRNVTAATRMQFIRDSFTPLPP